MATLAPPRGAPVGACATQVAAIVGAAPNDAPGLEPWPVSGARWMNPATLAPSSSNIGSR